MSQKGDSVRRPETAAEARSQMVRALLDLGFRRPVVAAIGRLQRERFVPRTV